MSVLKNKRKESCAEFLNDTYKIYVQTIEFLSRLSARYSRIMAADIASTAFEVLKYAESANAIYLANEVRVAMREECLLKAKASLETLDVALSVCYDVLMKNPSGAFTSQSGKDIANAESLKLTVNRSKTCITPLTKPFKYCKLKYTLMPSGRVAVNGCHGSMKRARKKFKAFRRMIDDGIMTYEDLWSSANGIIAYFEKYNDHNRVLKLRRLFYSLFGFSCESITEFRVRDTGQKGVLG